jgi:hypothetical protein
MNLIKRTVLQPKKLRDELDFINYAIHRPNHTAHQVLEGYASHKLEMQRPKPHKYFDEYLYAHPGILGKISKLIEGYSRSAQKVPSKVSDYEDMIDKLIKYFKKKSLPDGEWEITSPHEVMAFGRSLEEVEQEVCTSLRETGEAKYGPYNLRIILARNGYNVSQLPGKPVKYFSLTPYDEIRIADYVMVLTYKEAEKKFKQDLTICGDVEPNPGPRTKQMNSKKRSNRGKPKNRNKNPQGQRNRQVHFPLHPYQPYQNVQKNSEIKELTFVIPPEFFNNPGGPVVSQNFNLNDLFDVLPSILTPTVPFINYMFSLYRYGKVLSVTVSHTFANQENNQLSLYYFTSAQNLASSFPSKNAVVAQAGTRKLMWTDDMSEIYGKKSQSIMKKKLVPWMALGNKQEYMSSNDYSFTQSSNPVRIIYGAWVAISPLNTINAGLSITTVMNFKVKFYDALDLITPILQQAPPPSVPIVTGVHTFPKLKNQNQ